MKRLFILAMLFSLTSMAYSQGVYQIVTLLEYINTDDTFIIYGKKKNEVSTSAINGTTASNYMTSTEFYKKQVNGEKGEIYIHEGQTKKDIPAEFKLIPVEGKTNTYFVKLTNQEQYLFNKSNNYLILADETENQVTRKQWELRTSSFNGICLKNIGSGNFIYYDSNKFGAYGVSSSKDCLGVLCRRVPNAIALKIEDPFYTATVLPHDADFTVGNIGLTAFIVSDVSESVTLKAVDKAAEGEGIVLYANEQGKQFYPIFPSETTITKNEENKLLPSDGSVKGDGKTIYALGNKSQGVGFYIVKSGIAVPKDKPYLKIANENATSKEYLAFSDTEEDDVKTSIVELSPKVKQSDRWYNLKGQQVTNPQRGLYIHQGKKVFVE